MAIDAPWSIAKEKGDTQFLPLFAAPTPHTGQAWDAFRCPAALGTLTPPLGWVRDRNSSGNPAPQSEHWEDRFPNLTDSMVTTASSLAASSDTPPRSSSSLAVGVRQTTFTQK